MASRGSLRSMGRVYGRGLCGRIPLPGETLGLPGPTTPAYDTCRLPVPFGRGTNDMTTTSAKETLGFQTEVKQLLHLMIHSLYGNKEIFLRELISNASDACDKLRFESVADGALLEGDTELRIRVAWDRDARTITVSDNGIGLSRQEVIEHIGT